MSGEAAEAIEKVPAGEAVAEALTVLRGIFEPQGIQVPTPLQVKQQHSSISLFVISCSYQSPGVWSHDRLL